MSNQLNYPLSTGAINYSLCREEDGFLYREYSDGVDGGITNGEQWDKFRMKLAGVAVSQVQEGMTQEFHQMPWDDIQVKWFDSTPKPPLGSYHERLFQSIFRDCDHFSKASCNCDVQKCRIDFKEMMIVQQTQWETLAEEAFRLSGGRWKSCGPPVVATYPQTQGGRKRLNNRVCEDVIRTLFAYYSKNGASLEGQESTMCHLLRRGIRIYHLISKTSFAGLCPKSTPQREVKVTCRITWYGEKEGTLGGWVHDVKGKLNLPATNEEKKRKTAASVFVLPTVVLAEPKKEGKTILVTSENVRKSLVALSEAWVEERNPEKPKSVILWAPPGSGKEVLFKVTRGVHRQLYPRSSVCIELSAAGLQGEDFRDLLLEKLRINRCIYELRWHHSRMKVNSNKAPLVYIDEIDKSDENSRAYLLRVLQDRVFPEVDGEIGSCWWFFFTGSKETTEALTLKPKDFWTRMRHVVEMRHPFALPDPFAQMVVIKEYIDFFVQDHLQWWEKHSAIGRGDLPKLVSLLIREVFNARAARLIEGPLAHRISIRILEANVNKIQQTLFDRILNEVQYVSGHGMVDNLVKVLGDPGDRAKLLALCLSPYATDGQITESVHKAFSDFGKAEVSIAHSVQMLKDISRFAIEEFSRTLGDLIKMAELTH